MAKRDPRYVNLEGTGIVTIAGKKESRVLFKIGKKLIYSIHIAIIAVHLCAGSQTTRIMKQGENVCIG